MKADRPSPTPWMKTNIEPQNALHQAGTRGPKSLSFNCHFHVQAFNHLLRLLFLYYLVPDVLLISQPIYTIVYTDTINGAFTSVSDHLPQLPFFGKLSVEDIQVRD